MHQRLAMRPARGYAGRRARVKRAAEVRVRDPSRRCIERSPVVHARIGPGIAGHAHARAETCAEAAVHAEASATAVATAPAPGSGERRCGDDDSYTDDCRTQEIAEHGSSPLSTMWNARRINAVRAVAVHAGHLAFVLGRWVV